MSESSRAAGRPDIWPQARPLRLGTGKVGIVVSHGFTGSVQSIRPWAEALAAPGDGYAGARVLAPRLPGHGTSWQDLARTRWWDWYGAVEDAYLQLSQECARVFVAGLSMGGALALLLAQRHTPAGVLLVNPAIATTDRRIPVASLLHKVLPPQAGIASDIAKEGVEELGYPRFSVTSLATMTDLWKVTRRGLGDVHAPVLLLRSTQDHVVDGATAKVLTKRIRGLEQVPLTRSFHVATLDHDADLIAETSRRFVTRHA
ncbi:alpha/beta hydrolase [Tessaracoccus defluvii]|uniref:Alpha/beta fold hydrolase n=1 Tax=Tessaracoccus defluvii TaxID=1285901 RepID=A0A7H0H756_9ACTN|nr:alpha/beta fold hydrolase [Tessaracoccus defluvii]QNP56372.1 alpha/beta fold hydrolase [Tessaracoccus defluvii]